ncbi:MAG: phosphoribosyltransferase [Bacteroidales bacterium]|nr:phosphoribosyltransferase [Bacteroidales bacterium]
MSSPLHGTTLRKEFLRGDTVIYRLEQQSFINRYFLIDHPDIRPLLAFPEVIGFDCYTALLQATAGTLPALLPDAHQSGIDIFSILRGGLNYPLEEAAHRSGIPVRYMHFVSCERIIQNKEILGLDVRYQKITPSPDRIIAIGDILATGDTLRRCLEHLVMEFETFGGSIRKIILCTIGGTRAIELMEELTPQIRQRFPAFEGFDCCFYEGVFTVYTGKGVSGINTPNIDFGWKGGIVAPEFRTFICDHRDALLEKCIIYDGGARRYEIPLHLEEVLEYWNGILNRADIIDAKALVQEKLGYDGPLNYEEWLNVTALGGLGDLHALWYLENNMLENLPDLKDLAVRRINSINQLKYRYEDK